MEPEATPPQTQTGAPPLPAGWEEAVSPVDGRVYFYNASTGATSWTHPSVSGENNVVPPPPKEVPSPPKEDIENVPSVGDYSGILANRSTMVDDQPVLQNKSTLTTSVAPAAADIDVVEEGLYTKLSDYDPAQPIDSHRCYSVIAMILFFPLGVFAFCSSLSTVTKWHQGEYEKAHDRSQRALVFSRISVGIGAAFWAYFFYCYFAGPGPYNFIPPEWYPDVHFEW